MYALNDSRKAQVKPSLMNRMKTVGTAILETIWAVTANLAAWFVTLSIYAKGAPRRS